MTPFILNELVIGPVLRRMGTVYDSPDAARMLRTIALQESGMMHREQFPIGPARGLWQFEKGGGVNGVMTHRLTRLQLRQWCVDLIVPFTPEGVYEAIAYQDHLACVCARLLLYTHPKPLPKTPAEGWDYYVSLWRPGKPRPSEWAGNWAEASA